MWYSCIDVVSRRQTLNTPFSRGGEGRLCMSIDSGSYEYFVTPCHVITFAGLSRNCHTRDRDCNGPGNRVAFWIRSPMLRSSFLPALR